MNGCNCQVHQSYQSIYCMLNLNETASEAELQHAYEAELAVLEKMQPATATEQKLLEAKRRELIDAMERSKDDTLAQRVQAQYQNSNAKAVKLHSFFPVGLLGLILRLFNVSLGSGGWCDSCFGGIFEWCDRDCCGCSCCPDGECCFSGVYGYVFSNGICSCPSSIAGCYEDTFVVRVIDMGLVILAVIGAIGCYIHTAAEDAARRRKHAKRLSEATKQLRELNDMLRKRDDMVAAFVGKHDKLKLFSLDVRPFARFMSKLPGAAEAFVEMAMRIEQPGSFYDKLGVEFDEMREMYDKIVEFNQQIIPVAEKLQANDTHQELDDKEHCTERLHAALRGLENDRAYRSAVTFITRKG